MTEAVIQQIFMTYAPLDEYIEIPKQKLEKFERHGYTVIEWGGTELETEFEQSEIQ